ncbi:MAG: pyruvate ferredoxin oxidoreductase [Bacillota bacterium]
MSIRERLSGNEAAAYAIRQIDPDVIAAFPITPSTEIPQYISSYKADGKITTEFVTVESEHSAMSACIGAEAAGIRAMTASSSCGLALMHEMLYVAASSRLPIVLAAVNRALTGPININNDHSDTMGSRDAGWIQLYSENAQEAYDNLLMAHRIAEHPDVLLPLMVCQDGFITSHAVENITLEEDAFVKEFIGEYHPEKYLLNPKEAVSIGTYGVANIYMEIKRAQHEAMRKAKKVVEDVSADFAKKTGRSYGLLESYKMDDADYAVIVMSSSAGTGKTAVDELRKQGKKVGLVKLRCYRPFPAEEIAAAIKGVKALGIMDKTDSFNGFGGPLGSDVRAALYGHADGILTANYIYGLGGRDVKVDDFYEVFAELESGDAPSCRYLGVRE